MNGNILLKGDKMTEEKKEVSKEAVTPKEIVPEEAVPEVKPKTGKPKAGKPGKRGADTNKQAKEYNLKSRLASNLNSD